MYAILDAIDDFYLANNAGDFYTNTGGRFYLNEVPQDTDYPNGVYSLVTSVPEYFFDGGELERVTVQIDLWDDNRSAVDITNLADYCDTLFNGAVLTVSGYTHLKMVRENEMLFREPEDRLWRVMQQYDAWIIK